MYAARAKPCYPSLCAAELEGVVSLDEATTGRGRLEKAPCADQELEKVLAEPGSGGDTNAALAPTAPAIGGARILAEVARAADFADLRRTMLARPCLQSFELGCKHASAIFEDSHLAEIGSMLPQQLQELSLNMPLCVGLHDDGLAALAASLPHDLKQLNLDMTWCVALRGGGLVALASSLPPGLEELRLDLTWCVGVRDGGLGQLSARWPQTLTEVELNLRSTHIGAADLGALAGALPHALRELRLNLSGCVGVNDRGLAALATGMPRTLQEVILNFEACPNIGDGGVSMLGVGLPPELSTLSLTLSKCPGLGDGGLSALAARLPSMLRKLSLSFDEDVTLGDGGLAALAAGLPRPLQELSLSFAQCAGMGDGGMAALAAGLPAELQELKVNVEVSRIGDGGVAALAAGLPRTLKGLHLRFTSCQSISDGGLAALAIRLPRKLQEIRLGFEWCRNLGDSGLAGLATGLPRELMVLTLSLDFCDGFGDGGLAALAAKLPQGVRELKLGCQHCRRIGDAGLAALAAGLPPQLSDLSLNFRHASNITDGGLAALADALQQTFCQVAVEISPKGRSKALANVREYASWVGQRPAAARPSPPARPSRPASPSEPCAPSEPYVPSDPSVVSEPCVPGETRAASEAGTVAEPLAAAQHLEIAESGGPQSRGGLGIFGCCVPDETALELGDAGDEFEALEDLHSEMSDELPPVPANATAEEGDALELAKQAFRERRRRVRHQLRLDEYMFRDWMRVVKVAFPSRGVVIERVAERGVTAEQLRRVAAFAQSHQWGWYDTRTKERNKHDPIKAASMMHTNDWLILPSTSDDDCAFVELLADGPQAPEWFCSHWWGGPIADLAACVAGHRELRDLPASVAYWICAFAERQHSRAQDLNSTFHPALNNSIEALSACAGMLFVLDEQARAFTRAWCAYEAYIALCDHGRTRWRSHRPKLLVDIATAADAPAALGKPSQKKQVRTARFITDGPTEPEKACDARTAGALRQGRQACFPLDLLLKGLSLRFERLEATTATDRFRILNSIAGRPAECLTERPLQHHDRYDDASDRLRAAFAKVCWDAARQRGALESLGFPAVLAADRAEDLTLDLSGWHDLEPRDLILLFSALSQRTRRLIIRCGGGAVDDAALAQLGRALSEELTDLELRITACGRNIDDGLASLGAGFPIGLRRLHLDFGALSADISDDGLSGLVASLPAKLRDLSLNCQGCMHIGDRGLVALAAAWPPDLQSVSLDIRRIGLASLDGLLPLILALPQEVQRLEIMTDDEKFFAGAPASVVLLQRQMAADVAGGSRRPAVPSSPSKRSIPAECPAPAAPAVGAGSQEAAPAAGHRCMTELCCPFRADINRGSDLAALRLALRANPCFAALHLDLRLAQDAFEDQHLAELGDMLPPQLTELGLNLDRCCGVGNAGIAALAAGLPPTLQRLSLSCFGCRLVGNGGLAALAAGLPLKLHTLSLTFSACERVGDRGLAALAAGLPVGLEELSLDLFNCPNICDGGLAALALGLPRELQDLKLELSACDQIGGGGVAALGAELPKCLKRLSLKFTFCKNIADDALAALAAGLPRELDLVLLHFAGCCQVGDAGLAVVAEALPSSLESLTVVAPGHEEHRSLAGFRAKCCAGSWSRAAAARPAPRARPCEPAMPASLPATL